MERIRKGSDLPKNNWGSPRIQQKCSNTKLTKGHQLYILLSFDLVRALEIDDVARAWLMNSVRTRDAQ